ncbi:MAG TPA: ABC transporter permease [Firmicutes bacterium]|nr:ABC transporter permease [Bacillota bacterium]
MMIKYIVKRLAMGVVTMFFLITITFVLTRLMPGSPFATDNISPSVLATLEANYGLDKPIDQQFLIYLQSLLQGNLGVSYTRTGVTVNQLIAEGFPVTLRLGLISFAIALVVGSAIGIWMSTTKSSAVKGWLITGSTLFISIPGFVLAIVLLMVFGQWLKVMPVLFDGGFLSYIMPVLALAVYPIAQISRLVHASYTEAMNQDYVVMARAKGLGKRRIQILHVLKNALLPLITVCGPMIAFQITGSFVVESIFTIPGIGEEFVNSVNSRDYTVIMGLTIFLGGIIIIANLISDVACALVDPRVKIGKGN